MLAFYKECIRKKVYMGCRLLKKKRDEIPVVSRLFSEVNTAKF